MMENTNLNQNAKPQDEVKSGGIINEFLWTFAGVNKPILRQCPNEYAKYAGMGGTILGTAIMAAISGAYAIHFVFENTLIAIAFGIFWGTLILNLDRFIVSTMYSDGKHTVSWQELKSGLPRIIMAIFLGIVISTPLEMRLLEEGINNKMIEIQKERIKENMAATIQTDDLEDLILRKSEIEKELKRRESNYMEQYKELQDEEEGKAKSGVAGQGPMYKAKEDRLKVLENLYKEYKASTKNELSLLNTQIEERRRERNNQLESDKKNIKKNGFHARYEAFARIDDNNPELTMVIWFIRMLFIIIEVAPVFFRMMIATGSYDELLRAKAIYISKMAEKQSREVTDEYETEMRINTERNRSRLEAENQANKQLYYGIANAQSEVIAKAIENWKKQELEKVAKDPSAYIKIG